MTNEASISHERLEQSLSSLSLAIGPSEAHGVLCGLLCSGRNDEARSLWMQELIPDISSDGNLLLQECVQNLSALYQETLASFEGPSLGFTLLLPDDDAALKQRAEELVAWCQGFLYGLGLAQASVDSLSEETREGLRDITEITKLDLDALAKADSEQEEVDLTEVTEFIWVAAMLVREELVHQPKGE